MDKNYRNISYNGDHFVPYKSGVPTILKDDYPKRVAERARKNKFIDLQQLVYIMAADLQYTDWLSFLWKEYQCDIRVSLGPDISSVRSRIGVWQALFDRLAFGRVGGVPRKNDDKTLDDIIYLRLYRYNKVKGELELYDRSIEYSDHSELKVKLEDLEEYLNEITKLNEENEKIKLPLPALLYPKSPSQPEQEPKTKEQKYPEEVIDLLRKAKPAIEELYKGMMANWQEPDQEHGETYESALKDAAEEWFDKAGNNYQIITKNHVIHHHLYFKNTSKEVLDMGHIPRDFKGKLCQVIISDAFPKYIPDPIPNPAPKYYGYKTLYKLLDSL